jgi:methane/ammonia monooxygenase subunit C
MAKQRGMFMSVTAKTLDSTATEQGKERSHRFVNWGVYLNIILGISIIYAATRVYMHEFAYSVGLDYFEPEFAVYWMPLLYSQLIIEAVALVGMCSYLWVTRDKDVASLTPRVELQRYFSFIAWLVGYTFVILFAGSLAGEADAAWHQVVLRDTDFTPTHIFLFYLVIPALIFFGIGSFIYASTRLPEFFKRFQLPLCIAIGGPILIMPNVGLNEWGHTFFYAEELFAAPIHYGFAILGLALLALGGVVVHLLSRMKTLVDEIYPTASTS